MYTPDRGQNNASFASGRATVVSQRGGAGVPSPMVASREIARSANKMKRLQTQVHGSLGSRRNQGKLTGEVYQVLDGSFRLLTEEYDAMNHLTREAHQNIEAHKRKLSAVFSRLALSMALHVRRRSICMCALDRWRKFNYESIIADKTSSQQRFQEELEGKEELHRYVEEQHQQMMKALSSVDMSMLPPADPTKLPKRSREGVEPPGGRAVPAILDGFIVTVDMVHQALAQRDQVIAQLTADVDRANAKWKTANSDLKSVHLTLGEYKKQRAKVAQTMAKRFIGLVQQRSVFSTFSAWVEFYREQKRLRRLLVRIKYVIDGNAVARVFDSWLRYYRSALRIRELTDRKISQLHSRLKSGMFVRWGMYVRDAKRQQVHERRLLSRMLNHTTARSMARWAEYVNDRKFARRMIDRWITRLSREVASVLSVAFQTWYWQTDETKGKEERVKNLLANTLANSAKRSVFAAWNTWKTFVYGDAMHALSLEAESRVDRLTNKLLDMLYQLRVENLLRRVVSEWHLVAGMESETRKTIETFDKKRSLFTMWAGVSVPTVFASWKSLMARSRERRRLAEVHVRRKDRALLSRVFRTWAGDFLGERQRAREIQERIAKRWRNLDVTMMFVKWQSWYLERRAQRQRVQRIVGRLLNSSVSCAMEQWKMTTRDARAMEAKGRLMDGFSNKIDDLNVTVLTMKVFGAWQRCLVKQQLERIHVRRMCAVLRVGLMRYGFRVLQGEVILGKENDILEEKRQMAMKVMSKYVASLQASTLSGTFAAWVKHHAMWQRATAYVAARDAARPGMLLERVFGAWMKTHRVETSGKALCRKVILRCLHNQVGMAFSQWARQARAAKDAAAQRILFKLNEKSGDHETMHRLLRIMSSWKLLVLREVKERQEQERATAHLKAQEKLLTRTLSRMINCQLDMAFQVLFVNWKVRSERQRWLHRIAMKLLNQAAFDAFAHWKDVARSLKENAVKNERDKKFLRRKVRQMCNSMLGAGFRQWKWVSDEKERQDKFLLGVLHAMDNRQLHMRRRTLTCTLRLWKGAVDEANEMERRMQSNRHFLRKMVTRMLNRMAWSALALWKEHLAELKRKKEGEASAVSLLNGTMAKMLSRKLSASFGTWVSFTSVAREEAEQREAEERLMIKMFHRMVNRALAQGFLLFRDNVRQLYERRMFLRAMILRMANRKLFLAFDAVRKDAQEKAELERLMSSREGGMAKFTRRMMNRKLGAAFRQWFKWSNYEAVAASQRQADFEWKKRLVNKVMNRALNAQVSCGFQQWAWFYRERVRQDRFLLEVLQAMDDRQMHMRRRQLQHTLRLWRQNGEAMAAREAQSERDQAFLRKMMTRMLNRMAYSALRLWQESTQRAARHRELVVKMIVKSEDRFLRAGFKTWARFAHDALRAEMRQLSVEKEERDNIRRITRILTNMKNTKLRSAVNTWRSNALRPGVREREKFMRRMLRRWERKNMAQSFNSWRLGVVEEAMLERNILIVTHGLRKQLERRVLAAWWKHTRGQLLTRRVVGNCLKNFRARGVKAAFNLWCTVSSEAEHVHELHRLQDGAEVTIIQSFRRQSAKFLKIRVLRGWYRVVRKARNKMSTSKRCLVNWVRRELSTGFRRWHLEVISQSKLEQAERERRQAVMHKLRLYFVRFYRLGEHKSFGLAFSIWKQFVTESRVQEGHQVQSAQAIAARIASTLQILSHRCYQRQRLRGALQLWKAMAVAPTMALEAVKRINKYVLVSSAHVDAVETVKGLCTTITDVISVLMRCATGTLLIADRKRGLLWTMIGRERRRRDMSKGVVGHVADKKELLMLTNMYTDRRFDPEVDDIVLSREQTAASPTSSASLGIDAGGRGGSRDGVRRRQGRGAFGTTTAGGVGYRKPKASALYVPVNSLGSGVLVGVLCVTFSSSDENQVGKNFGPEDVAVATHLAHHISRVVDSLKRAMAAAAGVGVGDSPYPPPDQQHLETHGKTYTMSTQLPESKVQALHTLVSNMDQKATDMESKASSLMTSSKILNEQLLAMTQLADNVGGTIASPFSATASSAAHSQASGFYSTGNRITAPPTISTGRTVYMGGVPSPSPSPSHAHPHPPQVGMGGAPGPAGMDIHGHPHAYNHNHNGGIDMDMGIAMSPNQQNQRGGGGKPRTPPFWSP